MHYGVVADDAVLANYRRETGGDVKHPFRTFGRAVFSLHMENFFRSCHHRRTPNHVGSVFQRADGRWVAKYKDAKGTWRCIYRKSKGEAKRALRQVLKDRDEVISPNKMTAAAHLDSWLEDARYSVN